MKNIKAFWKLKSDLNIFKQRDYNKESIAKIQNLVTGNDSDLEAVSVEPVETRARKIPARAEPYKASNSLQERIKAQASYGRPKVREEIKSSVRFEGVSEEGIEPMEIDAPGPTKRAPSEILA